MIVYLAIAYRGVNGDNANEGDISANIERAREIHSAVQGWFPSIEFHIPHNDESLLRMNEIWLGGGCTTDDILVECCNIVECCDCVIAISPVSDGMQIEINHATGRGMDCLTVDWETDAKEEIAVFLWGQR